MAKKERSGIGRVKKKSHCSTCIKKPVSIHTWEFFSYYANLPQRVRDRPSYLSWDEIYNLLKEAQEAV